MRFAAVGRCALAPDQQLARASRTQRLPALIEVLDRRLAVDAPEKQARQQRGCAFFERAGGFPRTPRR